MDYQLIANIFLAVAGFVLLAAMLKHDMISLQSNDYSNKEFMHWLQSSNESYSTKRIVPMAALVACASQWARQSWMVVALIAVAILVLTVAMFFKKTDKRLAITGKVVLSISVILAIAAACGIILFLAKFSIEAGMLMLLFSAFSYVLTMAMNWIVRLFQKKK